MIYAISILLFKKLAIYLFYNSYYRYIVNYQNNILLVTEKYIIDPKKVCC